MEKNLPGLDKREGRDVSTKERDVATWYESTWSLQFWGKTLLTLSLYYWFVHRHNYIHLTNRRLTQKRGNFLSASETTISIDKITNIDVNASLLGRLFGYGDVTIQSAGSDASEVLFVRLARPFKLRDALFDLRDGKYDETR
jgi:uncharacterized membrane protein YdbT with pleckstrin-like domain